MTHKVKGFAAIDNNLVSVLTRFGVAEAELDATQRIAIVLALEGLQAVATAEGWDEQTWADAVQNVLLTNGVTPKNGPGTGGSGYKPPEKDNQLIIIASVVLLALLLLNERKRK